jgi:hypothetical protein
VWRGEVVDCVQDFAVGGRDVYYIACGAAGGQIHRLNPATAEDTVVGTLGRDSLWANLSVSPDETTIVYNKEASAGADLMLIENFK